MAILITIFVVSMVDVMLRATVFSSIASNRSNHGEVLVTAVISLLLIVFQLKGKERIYYILCGTWLGYFVMNQLFGLPGYVSQFVKVLSNATELKLLGVAVMSMHVISVLGIVGIGILLLEYMNDGSIYNKAFNAVCLITFITIVLPVFGDTWNILMLDGESVLWLSVLNNLERGAIVGITVIFAYDVAKRHLKKTQLSK